MNRYKWVDGETYTCSDMMLDTETGIKTQPVEIADILNEQDKLIKKLEKQNRELRLKLCGRNWKDFERELDKDLKIQELQEKLEATEQMRQELLDEGLDCEKQHIEKQNQIAIDELEKFRENMLIGKCNCIFDNAKQKLVINSRDREIIDYINKRIRELEGEK